MNLFALDMREQQQHQIAANSIKKIDNNFVNKTITFPKRGSLKTENKDRDQSATNMTTNIDGTNSNLNISSSAYDGGGNYATSSIQTIANLRQQSTARILVSKTKTRTGLPLLLKNSIN